MGLLCANSNRFYNNKSVFFFVLSFSLLLSKLEIMFFHICSYVSKENVKFIITGATCVHIVVVCCLTHRESAALGSKIGEKLQNASPVKMYDTNTRVHSLTYTLAPKFIHTIQHFVKSKCMIKRALN